MILSKMLKLIKNNRRTIGQLIRFLVIGGSNLVLSYVIYLILLNYIHYILASFISAVIGIANNYLPNKIWTFKDQENNSPLNIVKFFTLYAIAYFANLVSLIFFVEIILIKPAISALLVIPISTTITFFGQKYFVFNASKNYIIKSDILREEN